MGTAQGTLLVVDDNALNREALTRRLGRHGYTVAMAADGAEALAQIVAQPFDLVLLDIMMPGMSGLEMLRTLRAQYALADVPVIMVTAKEQSADVVAALQLGANDYVTKPIDFPVLLARVQTQLALKRATEASRHLAAQLEQHNRFIRETFGRYMTNEVVTALLDAPAGLRLGGERRQVTLLMADLRGFTSLASGLAPEAVITILNNYLGTMIEVIAQYQGTINEFIGDLILVIFGAPVWGPDHAERAVACAVAMQRAMATVNAAQQRMGLPEVSMGIGINTGEVVVGNIGSSKRAKYGVVGGPVNLTSRIESYTIGGQILIADTTRHTIDPILTITKYLEVNAKGLDQPVAVYDVQGIGGSYNLFLPERTETLVPLPAALPLRYTVLEGKYLQEAVWTGQLVTLSSRGGEVHTETPLPLWSDVKIALLESHGSACAEALYAKVLRPSAASPMGVYVHFTYVPLAIATLFQRLLTGDDHTSVAPSQLSPLGDC